MRRDSGTTDSIWPTTRGVDSDGPLREDAQAEVCVVGAGVVGLSCAYQLMDEGRKVVVLDDGPIGGGETGRTTAHLVSAIDDRYFEIARLHGERGAQAAAESHQSAIDWTEDVVRGERLKCHWRRLDGYLFVPPGESPEVLEKEDKAARRAGVQGVEWVDRAPMPGLDTGRCLRFANQGELDPSAYLKGLAKALRNGGVRIHTQTHASRLKRGNDLRIVTGAGKNVHARHVIEATNAPVFGHDAVYFKQAAYRTYVVAAPVPAGAAERALYWDTPDPYHYARLRDSRGGQQHLVVGGGDHRTGQEADAQAIYASLEAWMRQRWPAAKAVSHRWSGQVWEPVDALAFIGKAVRGNVYVATGDSGNGFTHAPTAARILNDLIAGRPNPWAFLYDPHRKTLHAAGEFLKETGHMVAALPRHFKPGEVESPEQIPPGGGALVRKGLRMLACYRDEDGELHERSAVCRHLGCIVNWNPGEKTWDCPCHGSRFDRFGTVVSGPANEDLARIDKREAPTQDGVRQPRTKEPPARPQPTPRVGRKRRDGKGPHGGKEPHGGKPESGPDESHKGQEHKG